MAMMPCDFLDNGDVIEKGTNYIKYADGTMMQWGYNITITNAVSGKTALEQVGTSGIYAGMAKFAFPISFSSIATCIVGVAQYSTGHCLPFGYNRGSSSTTHGIVEIYDFFARSLTDSQFKINYFAIGRWK